MRIYCVVACVAGFGVCTIVVSTHATLIPLSARSADASALHSIQLPASSGMTARGIPDVEATAAALIQEAAHSAPPLTIASQVRTESAAPSAQTKRTRAPRKPRAKKLPSKLPAVPMWTDDMLPRWKALIRTERELSELSSLNEKVRRTAWRRLYDRKWKVNRQSRAGPASFGAPLSAYRITQQQFALRESPLAKAKDVADFHSDDYVLAWRAWNRVRHREQRAGITRVTKEKQSVGRQSTIKLRENSTLKQAERQQAELRKPMLVSPHSALDVMRASASAHVATGYQAPKWLLEAPAKHIDKAAPHSSQSPSHESSGSSSTDSFAKQLEDTLSSASNGSP